MIFQPAQPFLLHKNEQGGKPYLVNLVPLLAYCNLLAYQEHKSRFKVSLTSIFDTTLWRLRMNLQVNLQGPNSYRHSNLVAGEPFQTYLVGAVSHCLMQGLLYTWTDSLSTFFATFVLMKISKNNSNTICRSSKNITFPKIWRVWLKN